MKKRNVFLVFQTLFSILVLGLVYFYLKKIELVCCCFMILFWGYVFIFAKFRVKIDEKIFYEMSEKEVLDNIKNTDNNFIKENFYIFVKNFMHFYYDAYMGNNLDKIKYFVNKDIYLEIENNVHVANKNNLSRIVEDLKIKGLILKNYYVIENLEYIEVLIDYKKNEFLLNKDKNIIEDFSDINYKKYVYTFCRKIGSKSKNNHSVNKDRCPGCGANNSNFIMGVCIRCGVVIYNYGDFVLCEIKEFKNSIEEQLKASKKFDTYLTTLLVIIIMAIFISIYGYDIYMFYLTIMNMYLLMILSNVRRDKTYKVQRTAEDMLNIEGLVDDNAFLSLDLNNDGYVGLDEYFPKTEEEVEKVIKDKIDDFSKDEFYKYIRDSIFIIEDGFRKRNGKLFSGYLNYNYYKRVMNNFSVKRDIRKLKKVVGVVLKDCIITDYIMTVKVVLTLKYADSKIPEIYLLTYINNLADNVDNNKKCINCGSSLKSGICDYCGTYNYFSYKGFILNDKVEFKIGKFYNKRS